MTADREIPNVTRGTIAGFVVLTYPEPDFKEVRHENVSREQLQAFFESDVGCEFRTLFRRPDGTVVEDGGASFDLIDEIGASAYHVACTHCGDEVWGWTPGTPDERVDYSRSRCESCSPSVDGESPLDREGREEALLAKLQRDEEY